MGTRVQSDNNRFNSQVNLLLQIEVIKINSKVFEFEIGSDFCLQFIFK